MQLSTSYQHLFHRLINRVINRETRPCEKGRNFELTQTKFKLTPCKLKTRATFPAEKIEVINSFSRAIIIIIIYSFRKSSKTRNIIIIMAQRGRKGGERRCVARRTGGVSAAKLRRRSESRRGRQKLSGMSDFVLKCYVFNMFYRQKFVGRPGFVELCTIGNSKICAYETTFPQLCASRRNFARGLCLFL